MKNFKTAVISFLTTVEPPIADTPFKRMPNSGPNRFFYKILEILPLSGGHLSLAEADTA